MQQAEKDDDGALNADEEFNFSDTGSIISGKSK
jgi:hypothetical protein